MTLSEKYPKGYFDHWIAMFSANNSDVIERLISEYADMYKSIEGDEAFSGLKTELQSILKNDDLEEFISIAIDYGLEKIEIQHLITMAEIIISK